MADIKEKIEKKQQAISQIEDFVSDNRKEVIPIYRKYKGISNGISNTQLTVRVIAMLQKNKSFRKDFLDFAETKDENYNVIFTAIVAAVSLIANMSLDKSDASQDLDSTTSVEMLEAEKEKEFEKVQEAKRKRFYNTMKYVGILAGVGIVITGIILVTKKNKKK